MTANVRCAGRDLWSPVHGQLPRMPCGWTSFDLAITETQLQSLTDEAIASTGRCPRCGGRVELIPQNGVS